MTNVNYYRDINHQYISEFLDKLNHQQQSKVIRIISTIEKYGLDSVNPHLRKVLNTPLWEIRILGKDNIRILYVSVIFNEIVLLHAFTKKTQKTPLKEIQIALNRLNHYLDK